MTDTHLDSHAACGHEHDHPVESYSARKHPEFVVLDIGSEIGALIIHTDPEVLGTEIEISARVVPGTPTAFADPGQLMAALLCLAIMARDAMAGGGRLAFEARPARAAEVAPDQGVEGGVAIVLNAQANSGAIGRPDRMVSEIRMVEDFVDRSNGRLEIGEARGAEFAVEILLPRGEALLA